MDSLSEFGTFACYFNAIVRGVEFTLLRFAHAPVFSTVCIIVAAVFSVLTSKLLIITVDLQFAQSIRTGNEEKLITTIPEERRSVMNLPTLLRHSAPNTCLGDALYELALLIVLVPMLRFSMNTGEAIQWYCTESGDIGWGGLMVLFVVGILLSAYLSFQEMEGVHMACVFLNVVYLVSLAFVTVYQETKVYEPGLYDFPTFVRCVCYPALIPSVMAASRLPSQRHSELQTWAVCAVTGIHLVLGILMCSFKPELNQDIANGFMQVCKFLIMPCAFVKAHLRFRALADTLVAWRYGMDSQSSQRLYSMRVKAVRLLLPTVVCLPYTMLSSSLDGDTLKILSASVSSILMVSFLIIPFSYSLTVRVLGEHLIPNRAPHWWSLVLYVGGLLCLVAIVLDIERKEAVHFWLPFGIEFGMAFLLFSWQVIDYYYR